MCVHQRAFHVFFIVCLVIPLSGLSAMIDVERVWDQILAKENQTNRRWNEAEAIDLSFAYDVQTITEAETWMVRLQDLIVKADRKISQFSSVAQDYEKVSDMWQQLLVAVPADDPNRLNIALNLDAAEERRTLSLTRIAQIRIQQRDIRECLERLRGYAAGFSLSVREQYSSGAEYKPIYYR